MPDDVMPGTEYAMPQDPQEWRRTKDQACLHSLEVVGDSIELAEGAIDLACDLFAAVEQSNPNDPRAAALVRTLGATNRLLLNALDLTVERPPLVAYAVLRPTMETAADAARIADDSALARIFAKRTKDEGE